MIISSQYDNAPLLLLNPVQIIKLCIYLYMFLYAYDTYAQWHKCYSFEFYSCIAEFTQYVYDIKYLIILLFSFLCHDYIILGKIIVNKYLNWNWKILLGFGRIYMETLRKNLYVISGRIDLTVTVPLHNMIYLYIHISNNIFPFYTYIFIG